MKVVFNRYLGILVWGILLLSLTGCAEHITARNFSDHLDQNELYKSYDVHPIDLSLHSQCNGPPSVKIVNIESRTEDYLAVTTEANMRNIYIAPKEVMDSVALYLKNGFEKSHIRVDDQSTKVLQLKMVEIHGSVVEFIHRSFFKMELIIPERNFSKFYEAYEGTGWDRSLLRASAYAAHVVTRQIIDDPVIQDYILCR